MVFEWKKLFPDLSKLRRIKRSTKNGQVQNNSGASDVADDGPVCPADPISSTSSNCDTPTVTEPRWRAVSDIAQGVLPVVAAAAEAIPVAGGPLKAAINGLLLVLRGIDTSLQNKQDIAGLKLRLQQLDRCLNNAPTTTDPDEQYRQDILSGVLEETRSKLANLNKRGFRFTARATKVIAGCSNDINNSIADYMVSSQIQIVAMLRGNQSPGNLTLQCVTLIDAAGDPHPVPMEYCRSFEQLTTILEGILKLSSNRTEIQRRYLEAGQYKLSIDRNTKVTQLTSDYWPNIKPETKIVMSLVVKQRQEEKETYQCHSCKKWNSISSANEGETLLIDCERCGRRFQVSRDDERVNEKRRGKTKRSPIEMTVTDIQLIRNWYIETEVVVRLPSSPSWNFSFSFRPIKPLPRRVRGITPMSPSWSIQNNSLANNGNHKVLTAMTMLAS